MSMLLRDGGGVAGRGKVVIKGTNHDFAAMGRGVPTLRTPPSKNLRMGHPPLRCYGPGVSTLQDPPSRNLRMGQPPCLFRAPTGITFRRSGCLRKKLIVRQTR